MAWPVLSEPLRVEVATYPRMILRTRCHANGRLRARHSNITCKPRSQRPGRPVHPVIDFQKKNGSGTWIRTKINGVRVRCSTVELSPNNKPFRSITWLECCPIPTSAFQ